MHKPFGTSCFLRFFMAAMLLMTVVRGYGQGMRGEYGKSIIQYKAFDWYYYPASNFDVYYYSGGRELAQYTLTQAEIYLKNLEADLQYVLDEKITFVIYNSYTDYRQSNTRLDPNDNMANTGGRSKTQSYKAYIYFNGSHRDFSNVVNKEIARIIINQLFYGGNFQEKLQNNVLLNLPDWYVEGMQNYLSSNWDTRQENIISTGIASARFANFKKLSGEEASIIAHSIWQYLAAKYGKETVSAIIWFMRTNKNIESGYELALGKSFSDVYDEWYHYEYDRLKKASGKEPAGKEAAFLNKVFKKGTVTKWVISENEDYAAVVTNDIGRVKIWIIDLKTGHKKIVFKDGYRYTGNVYDHSYPLIAWNTRKNELTVIFEKQSSPYYFHYNVDDKKRTEDQIITRLDRVLSFEYSPNGRTAVMSIVRKGQSDIVTFDFQSQVLKILTEDIYDDLEPHYVRAGKGVVFSSNRPSQDNTKVTAAMHYGFSDNYDIYYFPDINNTHRLKRLSNSPANESMPAAYDSVYFSYLTDENGVLNRNAVRLDSLQWGYKAIVHYVNKKHKNDTLLLPLSNGLGYLAKIEADTNVKNIDREMIYKDSLHVYALTNYNSNILGYQQQGRQKNIYELFKLGNTYKLLVQPNANNIENQQLIRSKGWNMAPKADTVKHLQGNIEGLQNERKVNVDTSKSAVDTSSFQPYFQSDFPVPQEAMKAGHFEEAFNKGFGISSSGLKFPVPRLYFLSFIPSSVITQFDNGIMNSIYLPYVPNTPYIMTSTISGAFKIGLTDMFDDYRFIGGFRLMANFKGGEYYLTYLNLKKRWDKKITFYRRGEIKPYTDITNQRVTSNEARAEFSYPFSETRALRMSSYSRVDRITYMTGEAATLLKPDLTTVWAGGKAEYVFDNSINTGLNLYKGIKAKVYAESFNALNKKDLLVGVIGADLRAYVKVSRQIIWANRIAMASSFGTSKVVYYLGGTENWFSPTFNKDNPVSPKETYSYMAAATEMRGFQQNIRNGSSYVVFNSEMRVPVFKYLFNRPFRSQFFENFQAVGFADAGTAWNGLNPFNGDNTYNTRKIVQGPLNITVINRRDPFVVGYGFGFRATLLSYFVRLDYAWGIEDKAQQDKMTYISMGLDF